VGAVKEAGTRSEVVWSGRRVRAFVPALLKNRDLGLDTRTAVRAASAAAELVHGAEALDRGCEPLARLLLRSEGVASSYIEGIGAPLVDIALAVENIGRRVTGAASWVASNLAAVSDAVRSAGTGAPLSVETLCDWHRILMTGSPTPERHVGRVRDDIGWIGGTSPLDAHLVTAPPSELPELLDDLVAYANRVDVDAVAQAAISHAQFEVVHPFADGNGRVGRLLVAWVLVRRLSLLVPPPVSVAIAADVGGFSSGLVLFRTGDHLRWIQWFADVVGNGGKAQRRLASSVEQIKRRWHEQLTSTGRKLRSDSAVHAALELLPRHLVLTSQILVDELQLSRKASLATLRRLTELGILTEYGTVPRETPGQPAALFVSRELLGLAGASPLR
jgi:Fic family protein